VFLLIRGLQITLLPSEKGGAVLRVGKPFGNCFVIIVFLMLPITAAQAQVPVICDAITVEIRRALDVLGKEDPPLYYLGCGITEKEEVQVSASFGALVRNTHSRSRVLDVDARCGNYVRDNTHPLPGHRGNPFKMPIRVPLGKDPVPIRMVLWRAIGKSYRDASERYAQVKALDVTKAALRDKSDDFSKAKTEKYFEDRKALKVDRDSWAEKVKSYTLPLRKYPTIYKGSASFKAIAVTRAFAASEGSQLRYSQVGYYLRLDVVTRSEDGLDLPVYESFFAWDINDLPNDGMIIARMNELAETAEKLRTAPMVEPFVGPAILEGSAAAVFMHEVLGHRLEGHRQKDEKESQTFRAMVGERIMPEFMTIIFNPGMKAYKNNPLSGHYTYDEQGVHGQKVVAVEQGILKEFLMCRTPIENYPNSNGHGRAQAGKIAVSRQSNLVIETSLPVPVDDLRKHLIRECIKQKKPYGLLFSRVQGGFTTSGRITPNAFNVMPLVVYRVYTDGRPDELVKGVDIIGTPITSLTKIIEAGDDLAVFNGFCGAESGSVPVGAASPSLLLSEIEVQKKNLSRARPPLLPPPDHP
jgi:TldD protein